MLIIWPFLNRYKITKFLSERPQPSLVEVKKKGRFSSVFNFESFSYMKTSVDNTEPKERKKVRKNKIKHPGNFETENGKKNKPMKNSNKVI